MTYSVKVSSPVDHLKLNYTKIETVFHVNIPVIRRFSHGFPSLLRNIQGKTNNTAAVIRQFHFFVVTFKICIIKKKNVTVLLSLFRFVTDFPVRHRS